MYHIVFGILLVHDDFSLTEGSNFSVFTSTFSIRTEKLDHYGMTGSRNLQKSRITGDYSFLYLFMLFLSGASMNSHLLKRNFHIFGDIGGIFDTLECGRHPLQGPLIRRRHGQGRRLRHGCSAFEFIALPVANDSLRR